jgi:CorA-like Mg2+ transporter protein
MAETPSLLLYGDRHFVRFLFPFALREAPPLTCPGLWRRLTGRSDMAAECAARIGRTEQWQPHEVAKPEYILPYVETFLFPEPHIPAKDRYVFAYQLCDQVLQQRLPKGGKCQFVVQTRREEHHYPVEVQEVHCYLFRSGVGILMLQVAMQPGIQRVSPPAKEDAVPCLETLPLDVEQLMRFTRAFRRIQRQRRVPFLRLPPRNRPELSHVEMATAQMHLPREVSDTEEERRVTIGALLDELLTPIGCEGDTWEAFYEHHFIGYTFALVSRTDASGQPMPITYEELQRPLFWLRRYVDPNYLPTAADLCLEDNPEVLQTFENIYFGLSSEGGAVLAWDSGVDFIRNQLHARVRDSYFWLFLLALHQRLAAIHLANLIGQTSYVRHSRRPLRRSVASEIRHLRTRIFEFMVRCSFAEVSTMKMYTDVYHAWQRVFRVEALCAEVKTEVEELDDYLQRLQMEREERIINLLTWIFLPLTLICGFWGMNFEELSGLSISNERVWLWTLGLLGLYYLFVFCFRLRQP